MRAPRGAGSPRAPAIDPGSSRQKEAPEDEEDEEPEDRRSSASFLRSLGGDDVDDLLNPAAAEPVHQAAQPPSLLSNVYSAPKPRKEVVRYFAPEPVAYNPVHERPKVCFLCGSPEHHASHCPGEVCFQCLQTGHTSKECPSGSGGGHVFLQRVRAITHRSQAPQLDVSAVRCVACGELGHVDCSPDDGRPKNLSCLNCGRDGHAALSCNEEGMDRWHRRFAPLAGPGSAPQGKGGGGARRPGGSLRQPGPRPEFRSIGSPTSNKN